MEICNDCFDSLLKINSKCGICFRPPHPVIGSQPDGTMTWRTINISFPDYNQCATIIIRYNFLDGIQNQCHPNPGQHYQGTTHTAYLLTIERDEKYLHYSREPLSSV